MMKTIHSLAEAYELRQATKQEEKRLAAELAGYATAAELLDLQAAVSRYPDDQTGEIRRLMPVAIG